MYVLNIQHSKLRFNSKHLSFDLTFIARRVRACILRISVKFYFEIYERMQGNEKNKVFDLIGRVISFDK